MSTVSTASSATGAAAADPNVAALRKVPIFAGVEPEALSLLAQNCRRQRIDASDVSVFHEGDEPGSLYVILRGAVHIRTIAPSGKSIHLAERGVGEHFGELALLDGAPRMADAVTIAPCEFLVLRREAFTRCVTTNPRIALGIMGALAQRLRESARHLTDREEQNVSGRLALLLLESASEHGAPVAGSPQEIRLTVRRTQQQMADQIGAARESVARALGELRRLKIVRTEGRDIVIQDRAKLKRHAERN